MREEPTGRQAPRLSGGTPVTLVSNQGTPFGIAVDANAVYWTNCDGGTVKKIAK